MSSRFAGVWANQLDLLFKRGTVASLGEAQLLERFVKGRDETAFAALVARHGPMVLGVCRRVLRDDQDVEDAFQATFLVLVRRANGIRNGNLVGHWLHGVAHRVAVRARAHAARRHLHEKTGADRAQGTVTTSHREQEARETRGVIDEELARLPQSLRAPMILCYFEGLTHDEAAERLQWPVGTVRSRMARARGLLRQRLERRGILAQLVLPTTSLPAEYVPTALFDATVEVSLAIARHNTMSSALLSTTAGALANGVIQTMTLSPLKIVGILAAACALAFGGFQTFGRASGGDNDKSVPSDASQTVDRPAAILQAVDKIQKDLNESSQKNADLQVEIKKLRDELETLRRSLRDAPASKEQVARRGVDVRTLKGETSSAPVTTKRSQNNGRAMGMGMGMGMGGVSVGGVGGMGMAGMSGGVGGMGMGGMGIGGGGGMGMGGMGPRMMGGGVPQGMFPSNTTGRLNFIANGSLIVVPSPEGEQVTAYYTETGVQKSFRLFDSKDPARNVVPLVTDGLAALRIDGPEISRVAVYTTVDGNWHPQDLRELVEAAHPIIVGQLAAYGLGRHVYAFSAEAKKWDVLTLPEDSSAAPIVQSNAVLVENDGHLYVFGSKSGKWVDIDTRTHLTADPKPDTPK